MRRAGAALWGGLLLRAAVATGGGADYDCGTLLNARWKTEWPDDKKMFCCQHHLVGCADFDCQQGAADCACGWTEAKKRWCARERSVECKQSATHSAEGGVAGLLGGFFGGGRGGCVPVDEASGASVEDAEQGTDGSEGDGCSEQGPIVGFFLRLVGRGCDAGGDDEEGDVATEDGSGGESEDNGEDGGGEDDEEAQDAEDCEGEPAEWRDWPYPKKQWCCENFNTACSDSDEFDCTAGVGNWKNGWSSDKVDWCCQNYDAVFCSKDGYSCDEGVEKWREGWSDEKIQWCCENSGDRQFCDGELEEEEELTQSSDDGAAEWYDCQEDVDNWLEGWEQPKKLWCCAHVNHAFCDEMGRNTLDDVPAWDAKRDCQAGRDRWGEAWSESRREWCCLHGGAEFCEGPAPARAAAAEPFECGDVLAVRDESEFAGWAKERRAWCCTFRGVGCGHREAPGASRLYGGRRPGPLGGPQRGAPAAPAPPPMAALVAAMAGGPVLLAAAAALWRARRRPPAAAPCGGGRDGDALLAAA